MFFVKNERDSKFIEYEGITFAVINRNVRYFRVEFKNRIPRIILPFGTKPEKILIENFSRIKKKYENFLLIMENADRLKFHNRDENQFRSLIESFTNLFSDELKVNVKLVKYRKMKRMWGNCRNNGIITFNSKLSMLPERVISYVVYHEILHLAEKGGHSIKFRRRMKEKFKDQKEIETALRSYFIKLNGEDIN